MPSTMILRSIITAVTLATGQLSGCGDAGGSAEREAVGAASLVHRGGGPVAMADVPFIVEAPKRSANGAPELPRVQLNTAMPAVTGRTISVPAGGDLQAAIDRAKPGDEIVLEPGARYTGPFTLRKKGGDGWIVIRSSGTLPAEGTRVTPAHVSVMPTLVSRRANTPVIRTESGASHYRLVGLEVTVAPEVTRTGALVALGAGTSDENRAELLPHHLVLDRMYIHGHPRLDFQRCISLQAGATAVVDSWISECHGKGKDSQAIVGWNGSGPYLIENNHLAGAGENVMFGGADPKIPGALPSDITIRRNHVVKPPEWKGVWTVKNLLELKIGRRVLVEGNVFENNWADGQTGFAILFKSVNQSGGAPWSETSDVTFRYNIVRNSAHGVSLAGAPEARPAVPASRITFAHNVFEKIGSGDFTGGRLWQVSDIADLTIEHNTHDGGTHALLLTGKPSMRLVVTDNTFGRTRYGVMGDGRGTGTKGLDGRAGEWTFRGNVVAGVRASAYPPGNAYPASTPPPSLRRVWESAARPPAPDGMAQSVQSAGSTSGAGADLDAVSRAVAGVVVSPS